jgi:hypothetical protein
MEVLQRVSRGEEDEAVGAALALLHKGLLEHQQQQQQQHDADDEGRASAAATPPPFL